MDVNLNDTQLQIRDNFHRFFEKESSTEVVRKAEPLGFDAQLWEKLTSLGVVAMGVSEEHGGSGAGLLDLVFLAQEFGRRIAPVPLVESIVAARLLSRFEAARSADWYGSAVEGDKISTISLRPVQVGGLRLVPAGAVADILVALDGDRLVAGPIAGDRPRPSPANLGTQPLANVEFAGEPVVLATGAEAVAGYEAARSEWKVLTAAALVGLSEQALSLAIDYAQIRKAFGIVIGSFQTVSHRIADDTVLLDGAYLLCLEAAWATDDGLDSAAQFSSMAFINAREASAKTTADAIHIHGGVGFTLECDEQLFFRRAKSWSLVYGDPKDELLTLADLFIGTSEVEARHGVSA